MNQETMNSDDSYSDEDEEEELDPRIQDELEKLNAATNSINHLEAELDEARAVFRQTLAGATYHLNNLAHKLGKCVEKSRPFYETYRQLRQSHGMLQKSSNQFERATGMHIAAKTRVMEAEKRVFGGGPKRAFDTALQEMLNQATIEVNEAEKLKRDSWKQHQEDLKAYRDLEMKVKKLYKKLKTSVDKAKPYFEQKREFDRHLWQLKLRVDSIQIGLSGAKENYSACLKSLEIISDDIHEKRKCKRMEAMLSKLQERESGVGADSSTEDETSLSASNLDLDYTDTSLNFDKLDGISDDGSIHLGEWPGARAASCSDLDNLTSDGSSMFAHGMKKLPSEPRVVYGLEATINETKTENQEPVTQEPSNEDKETNTKEKEDNDLKQSVDDGETDYVVKIVIGEETEVKNNFTEERKAECLEEAQKNENETTQNDLGLDGGEDKSADEKHDEQTTTESKLDAAGEEHFGQEENSGKKITESESGVAVKENSTLQENLDQSKNEMAKTDQSEVCEQKTTEEEENQEPSTTCDSPVINDEASQEKECHSDTTKTDPSVDKTSHNHMSEDLSGNSKSKEIEEINQEQSTTSN